MKIIKQFVVFSLIIASIVIGQEKTKIEQSESGIVLYVSDFNFPYKDVHKNNLIVRNYFQFTDPGEDGKFKLPYKEITVALPSKTHPVIKILDKQENIIDGIIPALNPEVKRINDSTLSYIDADYRRVSSQVDENEILGEPKYFWLRNVYCVQFKIRSHIFNVKTNQLHILNKIKISLEFANKKNTVSAAQIINTTENDSTLSKLIYNYENVKQYGYQKIESIKDSTSNWIDFNSTYLKYSEASNSIYRISKLDLIDNGLVNQSVDPRSFKLFESGKEISIYVKGEQDGSFDSGDYIEFIGGMNYPQKSHRMINADNQEYNEYLNRYTDSLYFFLTWGGNSGKRAPIQNIPLASTDTLDYYTNTVHYEKNIMLQNLNGDELQNQYPDWNKNKTWYDAWLFSTKSYSANLSNVSRNKSANIFLKVISGGSTLALNSHQLLLKLNGAKIDSQSVNRYKQALLHGSVNSNSLVEGTNQISVTNISNGTNPNFLATDWYEVEYPRQLIAQSDSIIFTIDANLDRRIRNVKIKNVSTANVVLYKSKPAAKKIESFQFINNEIIFSDTTAGSDQYILIPNAKIHPPQFLYKKTFPNLRSSNHSADYIAITHNNFLSGVQTYAANISQLYNVVPIVVNVSDIYDEFSFGYPYPEAIKSFLIASYNLWTAPKPKYCVLIGDANYDYKRFRFKNDGVIGGGNYVPSFGFPISDNWYTVWDYNSYYLQVNIGRLPINSITELNRYYDKVKNNFDNPYNDWNKKYIFFSGGSGNLPNELNLFKSINDTVISKFINKAPVGGESTHFYKTINPQTDFGPVTPEQFSKTIGHGAIIISYLGHSGTATWDNSINEINQLKNNVNRNPLITDFGCSTAKFGEPDIVCFGERFVLNTDGQAIAYLGNSSLGFVSTSTLVPQKFFEILANQPSLSVGDILTSTKISLLSSYGMTSVNKIFVLTNSLLGDPAVKLKLPQKPNLYLDQNGFLLKDFSFSENSDSTQIKYLIQNFGRVETKNYQTNFLQRYNNAAINEKNITHQLPFLRDTLSLWIKTKNYPGLHSLALNLDVTNQIDEIYKNDNTLTSAINVYSSSLRDLFYSNVENSRLNSIDILNPAKFSSKQFNIDVDIADNDGFQNPVTMKIPSESMFTKISLNGLQTNKRYWFRYKMDTPNSQFFKVKSFFNSNTPAFYVNDQFSFANQKLEHTIYNEDGVKLGIDTVKISVLSAGWFAGATCVIAENGFNLLTNSFFAGMGVAVFDESTLKFEFSDWYQLFNNPAKMQELVTYLNSIPAGKIVAIGVSDDAANNITSNLKNALKALGSTKIDSLKFRGSWAMITKRNTAPGEVIEKVKSPYDGSVQVEKIFTKLFNVGKLTTRKIGPVSSWKRLTVSSDEPANSQINYRPIFFDVSGKADTLAVLQINNNSADLSFVDSKKYSFMQMMTEFSSEQGSIPVLKSLGVDYDGVAELGTNYQGVTISKDTLEQGEKVDLSFYIYNAGSIRADNFKVKVEAVNKDNIHETIFEQIVDSIGIGQRKLFSTSYLNLVNIRNVQFNISIDPENKITELYKDNNIYSIPIYVKPNTKPASLALTIDGSDIIDGDFISPKPNIRIKLNDESLIPIQDTTAVQIYLNNKLVTFLNNSTLNYSFSASNPKFIVDYKPTLENGDYTLKVLGKNATGQPIDSIGVIRTFSVRNDLQLLNVYNYPNPFKDETYFTFKLTQIPDELKIKVYTIAGRMIKEFVLTSSELKYDFNRIMWDGRDADGDLIANGVYLYKVVTKKGSEVSEMIQKLAIVR